LVLCLQKTLNIRFKQAKFKFNFFYFHLGLSDNCKNNADSAADITPDLINKYNLSLVPTMIRFGDEIYYGGIDMDLEQYYDKFFASKVLPQTANPTFYHQYELFEKLGNEADETINIVIIICS